MIYEPGDDDDPVPPDPKGPDDDDIIVDPVDQRRFTSAESRPVSLRSALNTMARWKPDYRIIP